MDIQKLLSIIAGQKTAIFFQDATKFKAARIAIEARSDIKAYFDLADSRTEFAYSKANTTILLGLNRSSDVGGTSDIKTVDVAWRYAHNVLLIKENGIAIGKAKYTETEKQIKELFKND